MLNMFASSRPLQRRRSAASSDSDGRHSSQAVCDVVDDDDVDDGGGDDDDDDDVLDDEGRHSSSGDGAPARRWSRADTQLRRTVDHGQTTTLDHLLALGQHRPATAPAHHRQTAKFSTRYKISPHK